MDWFLTIQFPLSWIRLWFLESPPNDPFKLEFLGVQRYPYLMEAQIRSSFKNHFETEPLIAFAPGRINLIGEHTDYQEGFVFPAAVQFGIWVGVQKNQLPYCRLFSLDFEESATFDWKAFSPKKGHWSTYVMGFLAQLHQAGYKFEGFDMVIGGNIPVGAGLSSSAALSVSIGTALSALFEFNLSKLSIARYAQKSEHQYAGVNCGIMDPYASAFGKENTALLLDCRVNQHEEVSLDLGEYCFLLVNSNVKHSLADSAYNQRRAACEESVMLLTPYFPEIITLRDLKVSQLEEVQQILPEPLFPKAKHVISECGRVLEASSALRENRLELFGELLKKSHQSLSQDFEVSCPELDFLAQKAFEFSGVLGARMMGGGFGGCTINLIKKGSIEAFKYAIAPSYEKKFGKAPSFIQVEISEGARVI
ncbi:galactokinase [Algoriphagus limi]|uniref:Galactokinase n=1 Tax=Algoriphagus limi TaxID=2975273 RepID=A0ABT2G926_9BACT|nr:galactokinase [Algoriphagus limi]MCS5491779.1 galactokinase [Algoriphagus limi]